MRHIFMDTETTGLIPTEDRVVEIAAVAYEDRQRVPAEEGGAFHCYCNPERNMPEEARNIHGLTSDFLADKPVFAAIADELIAFIKDSEVIMHNAPFDEGMLNAELHRLGKPPLSQITAGVTCSLELARTNKPGLGAYSLNALCRHYGISLEQRDYHSALLDSQLLGDVYYRICEIQGEIKMHTRRVELNASFSEVHARPANAEETAAHEALLAQMGEELGKPPIYKRSP